MKLVENRPEFIPMVYQSYGINLVHGLKELLNTCTSITFLPLHIFIIGPYTHDELHTFYTFLICIIQEQIYCIVVNSGISFYTHNQKQHKFCQNLNAVNIIFGSHFKHSYFLRTTMINNE